MALGVGDILRTSCNFLLGSGDQFQNVYHHIFDGTGGVSDAAVVADIDTWASEMYQELESYISDAVVAQLCSVDQVEFLEGEWTVVANIGVFTVSFTPSVAGQVAANQIAPFVVFKTDRPKSVGRKFLFPTPEVNQDGGVMGGILVDAIVAYAADAVNDIEIDILNVLHPGITRVGVNNFLIFQVAIVTDLVGTQRRRRPGYGA